MAERWEVERDRFGVMFSGPLEIGECVEVVPHARAEKLAAALREIAGDDLRAGPTIREIARAALAEWEDSGT